MTARVSHAVRRFQIARFDVVLALLVTLELVLEVWLVPDPAGLARERPLQTVAAVALAAPIAFRRRWPAGALLTCASVAFLQALAGGYLLESLDGSVIPLVILAFTTGSRLELRRSVAALFPALVLLTAAVILSDVLIPPAKAVGVVSDELVMMLIATASWLVGRLAQQRTERAEAFRELGLRLASEQEAQRRAEVIEERIRIDRELQDILAHSVSVMVIQAATARKLLDADPERARNSILQVEMTGREVLADLRSLLGMLRKDTDARALTPQPGLGELKMLLNRIAGRGLRCALRTDGPPIPLAPGIELVGYRVVEAALWLAADHAAKTASVTLRYGATQLELDVDTDASITDAEQALIGIADRVALYEGTLRVSQGQRGSYAVRVTLPISAVGER